MKNMTAPESEGESIESNYANSEKILPVIFIPPRREPDGSKLLTGPFSHNSAKKRRHLHRATALLSCSPSDIEQRL
ncbi:hypothetical protein EV683_1031 [Crenobacter luteus]|uniref:hypothetical protein n=1 Tax=Crenobacter luteus TaxID=1452487 RepID=UPI0010528088|nr:hypothetical protein [Crenobacter luteus]TCP14741.1 hypothetical protein EV683_1031 [Crenobacter luteus]